MLSSDEKSLKNRVNYSILTHFAPNLPRIEPVTPRQLTLGSANWSTSHIGWWLCCVIMCKNNMQALMVIIQLKFCLDIPIFDIKTWNFQVLSPLPLLLPSTIAAIIAANHCQVSYQVFYTWSNFVYYKEILISMIQAKCAWQKPKNIIISKLIETACVCSRRIS